MYTLKVYDVLGNEVATLVNEEKPAGTYEIKFDATGFSSGIYFYKLQAGSLVETKKMILYEVIFYLKAQINSEFGDLYSGSPILIFDFSSNNY